MGHSRSKGKLETAREPWIEIKTETVRKRNANYRIQREVEAMRYVQQHTSIPVPYVIEVQLGKDEDEVSWFVMERLGGVQLDSAWSKLDSSAQARTISQIKSYFAELHALRPPTSPGWIGSCSKGPAYDHRINNMDTCGPFASVKEFHDMLVAPAGNVFPNLIPKYRPRLPDDDQIVFAHGDVSYENILVDPTTGHVTGIIDWETAGFWPRWWEYRKGLCGARSQIWWDNILKQIMVAYPALYYYALAHLTREGRFAQRKAEGTQIHLSPVAHIMPTTQISSYTVIPIALIYVPGLQSLVYWLA